VAVAEERARQLSIQLERVKALEEAARGMADSMQRKAQALASTVEGLDKRAAEAQERAHSLDAQLQTALQEVLPTPALHCTVLYCTILYCTMLYCTALYCTVLHCTPMYPHCTAVCAR